MPLKNMRLTEKESKGSEVADEAPRFPYGLSIHLDEDSISKLELGETPDVGKEMTLVATVKVESKSENETMGGKKERSVSLQITEMSLENKVSDDKLSKLYSGE